METMCNHRSVGVILEDLTERKIVTCLRGTFPPGIIGASAGHVEVAQEDGDEPAYRRQAVIETQEEIGVDLDPALLREVLEVTFLCNPCRRGENWHHWRIYHATLSSKTPLTPSSREIREARWRSYEEVSILAERSHNCHLLPETAWTENPGLEPVWSCIFFLLGYTEIIPEHLQTTAHVWLREASLRIKKGG